MSNSPLWRIKKQNPLFQKTKSKQALMTDLGAELGRFAVRRLPNKLMLQHPYSCFQDSANELSITIFFETSMILL